MNKKNKPQNNSDNKNVDKANKNNANLDKGNKEKQNIKGDGKMENVIERENVRQNSLNCEMEELMAYNQKIIRENGFSKEDVRRIVEEERVNRVDGRSRY